MVIRQADQIRGREDRRELSRQQFRIRQAEPERDDRPRIATNTSGAPATNRLWQYAGVTALSYDNSGNQTFDGWQSHTYDAANRLKTALNNTSSYEYDGEGHRIKQTNSAGTIYYLWSSVLGQVTAEIAGSSVYRAYVYSAGGQMLALQSYYGDFYWVHQDHLGSSRKMTDMSGNVIYRAEFDPYGQTVFEWSNYGTGELYKNSKKYTGYERDWATNLDNANARTLNHKAGRFLQADPLGLGAADATNPHTGYRGLAGGYFASSF